ncbi:hypothetical protein TcBrA4_0109700 [Trypanosoma cruzi]|nr:hypothetical protein TcBrA4_0109700 [Trypanosoma cruzi]
MNGRRSEALSSCNVLRVTHWIRQTTRNYPLLGGIFASFFHNGAALGGSFRAAAATTRLWSSVFVSIPEWRESEALSLMYVACSQHWEHQTTRNLSRCLENFRELLPTMVLRSADRFTSGCCTRRCGLCFVSNYDMGESAGTPLQMYVCVFTTYWTRNTRKLSRCLEEFRRAPAHKGAAVGGSFFEAAAAIHTSCGHVLFPTL